MDTTETTHISLCAGYGGIDLGLKRVVPNLRTVLFVEREAFGIGNLVAKMEASRLDVAPIWADIKTFNGRPFRDRVHIISGGYPCQPFSTAGKRKGTDDPRHLWPYIARTIADVRPRYCFFENVQGHVTLGLREVLTDLAGLGYRVENSRGEPTWGLFSAEEVGSPQERFRVFILAYHPSDRGSSGFSGQEPGQEGSTGVVDYRGYQAWPSDKSREQYEWEPPQLVYKPKSLGQQDAGEEPGQPPETRCGLQTSRERKVEYKVVGSLNGDTRRLGYAELCVSCDSRVDELYAIGNGCVPAQVAKAWNVLYERSLAI